MRRLLMTGSRTPVVFIHGLWLHATSWGRWLDLYREAGYEPIALGWLGEPLTVAEAREHPELVADKSIDDEVAHYTEIIQSLDAKPIIVRLFPRRETPPISVSRSR
jgi:hypothetical protein